MEATYRRYPIGIQNFEQLRNNNCVYVDKTELIYQLTHTDKIYFLSMGTMPRCWTQIVIPNCKSSFAILSVTSSVY